MVLIYRFYTTHRPYDLCFWIVDKKEIDQQLRSSVRMMDPGLKRGQADQADYSLTKYTEAIKNIENASSFQENVPMGGRPNMLNCWEFQAVVVLSTGSMMLTEVGNYFLIDLYPSF